MSHFTNKTVIVTGAAGGIGAEIARQFESHGATIFPTDIAPINHEHAIIGDISSPEFINHLVDSVHRQTGRIDVLVNNAGICPRHTLFEVSVEEWRKVLDVNLTSAFLLSQRCMKIMIEQKFGAIVSLASLAGKIGGIAVGAHYSASKAAIICLTKTLARTGAAHNVRANAVAPGVIDTDITRAATPEQIAAFKQTIPLGRIGDAAEVARPILFLASDEASYITGVTLDINGGLLMD
jgi:3-oxoacyl-[acyl-carrier protein] reductase